MDAHCTDRVFAGSVPEVHDSFLVPLISSRTRAISPLASRREARAYCQGTPLREEIERRRPGGLAEATAACAEDIARRFGEEGVDGRTQAHVVAIAAVADARTRSGAAQLADLRADTTFHNVLFLYSRACTRVTGRAVR